MKVGDPFFVDFACVSCDSLKEELSCLLMKYLPLVLFKASSVSIQTRCLVESSFSYRIDHVDVRGCETFD